MTHPTDDVPRIGAATTIDGPNGPIELPEAQTAYLEGYPLWTPEATLNFIIGVLVCLTVFLVVCLLLAFLATVVL